MKVSIVGSHGLYAKYGGWDQLVINLALLKNKNLRYFIFNPKETPVVTNIKDVQIKKIPLSGSGFQGLIFDALSILLSFNMNSILMLGMKAMPVAAILKIIRPHLRLIVNIGGIEWERPQYNNFLKLYLRFCLYLVKIFANKIIIDNKHYEHLFDSSSKKKLKVIAYGGDIDKTIKGSIAKEKYNIQYDKYFLSISRSISDNKIKELCNSFVNLKKYNLVLISNFSNSKYGINILKDYSNYENIHLIDGLYDKPYLDAIRRESYAYIHTHTLCGSAPSLIEMIVSQIPIFSIDVPQNRYTLSEYGFYFKNFNKLINYINENKIPRRPPEEFVKKYTWEKVVISYENCFVSQ